jgi:pyrroline-5-carboxylate reductase
MTPVLLIGAGRLGGALLQGWRGADAFPSAALMIRCPRSNPAVEAAVAAGAAFNPPDADLAAAQTVVLAVKPQLLREVALGYAPLLSPDAVVVSVAVGVSVADLAAALGGRRVARAMPTTGVAVARGVAALYAEDPVALARARALFEPVATVVELPREALMLQAGAVAGSGPAYLYAFVEALERVGEQAGLPPDAARTLARAAVVGAAAHLDASGADPAELRRQVASPGGITEAALKVLQGDHGPRSAAGRGCWPPTWPGPRQLAR